VKTETLLLQMRDEQQKNHEATLAAIGQINAQMAAHNIADTKAFGAIDKRLEPVESMRKTFRWAAASGFIALVGVLAQAGCSYVGTHFKP
jgi:hypothetical protein